MSFLENIRDFALKITTLKECAKTEEATKHSLVLPFLSILGYDVFNPREVIPEYDCDLDREKGEKCDYAIFIDSSPIMLIECKHWELPLERHNTQLRSYFTPSGSKFGVLTNGIVYNFYTDMDRNNVMDEEPFFSVNLESLSIQDIKTLERFRKDKFDADFIRSDAERFIYLGRIRRLIVNEYANPSEEFVKFFGRQVYSGSFRKATIEDFTSIIKEAFRGVVDDMIRERFEEAKEKSDEHDTAAEQNPVDNNQNIVTNESEKQGHRIVQAIVSNVISPDRVTFIDRQAYSRCIIDGKIRQVLIEFYFNNESRLKFKLKSGPKKEIMIPIKSIEELYEYSAELREIASI